MAPSKHRNALASETSPYLLQHADNPVAWFPWGEEALKRAKQEDKPILLSIGYSACHWCHVMAHESFENDETAALMNDHFVNIKVDREQRPDLDKIYQTAHQLLTQRAGGWPLTMFLTPEDQAPFFGGTYFPREPRSGLPGFKDLLLNVSQFYKSNRDAIKEQNESLIRALSMLQPQGAGNDAVMSAEPLELARRQLTQIYDAREGGFGSAPKFPHPTNIERLLRDYATSTASGRSDTNVLEMALFTLRKMALGGIYDQLGGGFYRYSVDERWMIPHFEKMLYDNGPLLTLYSDAWQITRDPLFEKVALETADWVIREMQSLEGGFYSTLDADSGGMEGKFYVWSREEVSDLLSTNENQLVARYFGLDRDANFEGKWHLHVACDIGAAAQALGATDTEAHTLLKDARRKLFEARNGRIRPGRDEKILTSWNGLMIKGMATAGRIFEHRDYVDAAERALDFVRKTLWRDRRLLATYKDGKAHLNAYLDDYAFMIDAILTLLEARWRDGDLPFAIQLADVLLDAFQDNEQGGFFFTSDDHEQLIQRSKPLMDDALPAGNGIAAYALGRLGHITGETRYLDSAECALRASYPSIEQSPATHNALLLALEEYLQPPQTIILRGQRETLQPWRERCLECFAPRRLTLTIPTGATDLPGVLGEQSPNGEAVAYVCEGHECSAPIESLDALAERLKDL